MGWLLMRSPWTFSPFDPVELIPRIDHQELRLRYDPANASLPGIAVCPFEGSLQCMGPFQDRVRADAFNFVGLLASRILLAPVLRHGQCLPLKRGAVVRSCPCDRLKSRHAPEGPRLLRARW